ncbi:hypothetical protein [Sporolactobacillus laevolacticus]|uniref:Uncharacterized protein n=1 Tax=Sporolactobacillus laevolacticus DSM 442 TaxID=1395513 RepID=V6IXB3_9BACL|nr:hypothetical protein [Sporolactobacillus laevolacticus]EST11266.1 hypothetical protein P343_12700 [Sporolactobacillus laevolacticus DSM 442]
MKVKIFGESTLQKIEKKANDFLDDKKEENIIKVQFFSDAVTESIGGLGQNGMISPRYNFYVMIQYRD